MSENLILLSYTNKTDGHDITESGVKHHKTDGHDITENGV